MAWVDEKQNKEKTYVYVRTSVRTRLINYAIPLFPFPLARSQEEHVSKDLAKTAICGDSTPEVDLQPTFERHEAGENTCPRRARQVESVPCQKSKPFRVGNWARRKRLLSLLRSLIFAAANANATYT